MSAPTDTQSGARVPPDGRAWDAARREVADRNQEARKAGKAQRKAHERRMELLRAARESGIVYR